MPHNRISALPTLSLPALMTAVVLFASLLFAFSQTARAMGGSDNPSPPAGGCPTGTVWSSSKGKCVKTSGALDEDLYQQGRAYAHNGQYERAIELLQAVSDQNAPRVLNYLGYSYRKMGQLDKGITYYAKALAINPDFVLAREYLGEGYVAAGKFDLARGQLREIEQRCGKDCKEYKTLAQVIADAGQTVKTN